MRAMLRRKSMVPRRRRIVPVAPMPRIGLAFGLCILEMRLRKSDKTFMRYAVLHERVIIQQCHNDRTKRRHGSKRKPCT